MEVALTPVVPSQIASNFGSDVLVRPEDEDSPEFREYLRQLLRMQVVKSNLLLYMVSDLLTFLHSYIHTYIHTYIYTYIHDQANRAKTGHAAPSSGSADAYISKLTRLKIEKNMRWQAGLPNDSLDLSYKPEDYAAAM